MSLIVQLPLFYLALYFLVSGLDDLSVDLRLVWDWLRRRWARSSKPQLPELAQLRSEPQRRIAIMVPLWQESQVVRAMVETNLSQIEYRDYAFFLGVYPNDAATVSVARSLEREHGNVHVVVCSRPGPTSKADCLNHIYRYLRRQEFREESPYELVMLHDAEDVLHPMSLALVNWYSAAYGMVQVPVLPFPTPLREWVHGVYCDEFAEFLSRDMRLREVAGAFLPSNGVGTAIRREYLDALEDIQDGVLFDAECLTEDYELGMKLAEGGCPQIFLPLTRKYGDILATREYFPRRFLAACRQRSRWISGQCLQSWERHGWPLDGKSCYWFWRDRKGLWGNLLSFLALLLTALSGLALLAPEQLRLGPWLWMAGGMPGANVLYVTCTLLALERVLVRTVLVSRIYGFGFAWAVPVRILLSTVINARATVSALHRFAMARARNRRLRWAKTEHSFPLHTLPAKVPVAALGVDAQVLPGAVAEAAQSAKAKAASAGAD